MLERLSFLFACHSSNIQSIIICIPEKSPNLFTGSFANKYLIIEIGRLSRVMAIRG